MNFLIDEDTSPFLNGFKTGFNLGEDYNYSSYGSVVLGEKWHIKVIYFLIKSQVDSS